MVNLEEKSDQKVDGAPGAAAPKAESGPIMGVKVRSETTYPGYPLGKAIEIVEAVRRAGGKEAPNADVMRELGVTSKTDRLWAYGIPAATYFGLIERGGRGDDGRIKVTDLALRIVASENDIEKHMALVAAFKTPELYASLLEKFAGAPQPSKEGLKNILWRDYKIVESMAPNAAAAFLDSLATAEVVVNGIIVASDGAAKAADEKKLVEEGTRRPTPLVSSSGAEVQTIPVPPDFIAHQFQLRRDLRVTIPLPAELTAKDVDRLHKWLGTLTFDEEP